MASMIGIWIAAKIATRTNPPQKAPEEKVAE
jgi:hypothetical protein